jgi:hypothetical protein
MEAPTAPAAPAAPAVFVDPALFEAARDGATDKVLQWFLSHDEHGGQDSVDAVDEESGDTSLHAAVKNKHSDVVLLLLEHGADPNYKSKDTPPLVTAALRCCLAIAWMLLKHGADIERRNEYGDSPMHMAAGEGDRAMVQLFLKHHADVSSFNLCGTTPLHYAALENEIDMCRLLIQCGADVEARDVDGQTAEEFVKGVSRDEITLLLRNEAVRRSQCLAFAMGQHERLGAMSVIRSFDPEVVRMVFNQM